MKEALITGITGQDDSGRTNHMYHAPHKAYTFYITQKMVNADLELAEREKKANG